MYTFFTYHRDWYRKPADLGHAVGMRDDPDDVVQRQQAVALDLRVHVLALGTAGQQLHQVDVVEEWARVVQSLSFRLHHLDQRGERVRVVVEHQNFFAHVHELEGSEGDNVQGLTSYSE